MTGCFGGFGGSGCLGLGFGLGFLFTRFYQVFKACRDWG